MTTHDSTPPVLTGTATTIWYQHPPFPLARSGYPRLAGWVMTQAEAHDTLWADGEEIWIGPGGATAPGRDVPAEAMAAWQEALERGDADTAALEWRLSDRGLRPAAAAIGVLAAAGMAQNMGLSLEWDDDALGFVFSAAHGGHRGYIHRSVARTEIQVLDGARIADYTRLRLQIASVASGIPAAAAACWDRRRFVSMSPARLERPFLDGLPEQQATYAAEHYRRGVTPYRDVVVDTGPLAAAQANWSSDPAASTVYDGPRGVDRVIAAARESFARAAELDIAYPSPSPATPPVRLDPAHPADPETMERLHQAATLAGCMGLRVSADADGLGFRVSDAVGGSRAHVHAVPGEGDIDVSTPAGTEPAIRPVDALSALATGLPQPQARAATLRDRVSIDLIDLPRRLADGLTDPQAGYLTRHCALAWPPDGSYTLIDAGPLADRHRLVEVVYDGPADDDALAAAVHGRLSQVPSQLIAPSPPARRPSGRGVSM